MRGVYGGAAEERELPIGSSPRAWGLLAQERRIIRFSRFIPTCVGFTAESEHQVQQYTVHPHVRGVYESITPFTRGNVRFIPTCVGFTDPVRSSLQRNTVHPHVRGVYYRVAQGKLNSAGSSPRAWGLHGCAAGAGGGARFIPTCVGFTGCPGLPACLPPVHPHVRGVYPAACCLCLIVLGSSPRAWGLRGYL